MNEVSGSPPEDQMMMELRSVVSKINQDLQPLTGTERIAYHERNSEFAASSRGKKWIPHPTIPFARICVPIDTGQ